MRVYRNPDGNGVGIHSAGLLAVGRHGMTIPVALGAEQRRAVARELLSGAVDPSESPPGKVYVVDPPLGTYTVGGPYLATRGGGAEPWTVFSASERLSPGRACYSDEEVTLIGPVSLKRPHPAEMRRGTYPSGVAYVVDVDGTEAVGFRNDPGGQTPWEVVSPTTGQARPLPDATVNVIGRSTVR